jgi:AmmeMemoRadiSam system protein B
MSQPTRQDRGVRPPAVAGRFYPASREACISQAVSYLTYNTIHAAERRWFGGLVPHAGWICSGAIAGQTIATMAHHGPVDVVVVFGAVHTPVRIDRAALDTHSRWSLPGGAAEVAQDVQATLAEQTNLFVVEQRLHQYEHAVEVEVPLIQVAFPSASILPVEVPVHERAAEIGRAAAKRLADARLRAVFLASSDLTHYGTNYGFTPAGLGPQAMAWTKQNDLRLLNLIASLADERVLPEVAAHHNACGAGAIVAMLAACREMGAGHARLLHHATSYETLADVAPQPPTNAVGYAALVVG